MILYYALGGGLGHLVRARKVLEALGAVDAALLSASPFARDRRVVGEHPVVPVPPRLGHDRAAFTAWLVDMLGALRPDELIVDSFPGGILGELCGLDVPPARHVARRLRWPAYARRLHGTLPRFEVTHVLEPLAERHERALAECSQRLMPLQLPIPRTDTAAPLTDHAHWLVVHCGPDDEVELLTEHAAERTETRLLVVSPRRPTSLPPRARWLDVHPVAPHLAHAERVVTAGGFNAMHETSALRERHVCIPFPRPLDDQFARAAARSEHDRAPVVRDHAVVEVAA
jgi:hypothetical protein